MESHTSGERARQGVATSHKNAGDAALDEVLQSKRYHKRGNAERLNHAVHLNMEYVLTKEKHDGDYDEEAHEVGQ